MNQITPHILMVRPANFGFNAETAANNSFQSKNVILSNEEVKKRARQEFDDFVEKLTQQDIHVIVIEDTPLPVKSDAVFPNNWITFHQDGSVVTYPMFSPNRRNERRLDIIDEIKKEFVVTATYRLEKMEKENRFLEGTGSMILDRVNKIVYACNSPRTDKGLLDIFCKMFDYEKVVFTSVDANDVDIYHTNVMMALGEDFVVICLESIKNEEEKNKVLASFEETEKEVIEITFDQVLSFAGNMLQVRNRSGKSFLVMSQQAYHSLTEHQIERIKKRTEIIYSPIDVIEALGGGSTRCMMAEVFLPLKLKK